MARGKNEMHRCGTTTGCAQWRAQCMGVPALSHLVQAVCPVLEWTGQLVQSNKSKIVGVDMKTGKSIATDSITLNGEPFAVLSPNEPHKHLGVRMTMLGNVSAETEHVRSEMRQRLAALKEDRVLSRPEKELIIATAICSVFRESLTGPKPN